MMPRDSFPVEQCFDVEERRSRLAAGSHETRRIVSVVKPGLFLVAVPPPDTTARTDEVEGVAENLQVRAEPHGHMEASSVAEMYGRHHSDLAYGSRAFPHDSDRSAGDDLVTAEPRQPVGDPEGRRLRIPHMCGQHRLPTGEDLIRRPGAVPGVEVLALIETSVRVGERLGEAF